MRVNSASRPITAVLRGVDGQWPFPPKAPARAAAALRPRPAGLPWPAFAVSRRRRSPSRSFMQTVTRDRAGFLEKRSDRRLGPTRALPMQRRTSRLAECVGDDLGRGHRSTTCPRLGEGLFVELGLNGMEVALAIHVVERVPEP